MLLNFLYSLTHARSRALARTKLGLRDCRCVGEKLNSKCERGHARDYVKYHGRKVMDCHE